MLIILNLLLKSPGYPPPSSSSHIKIGDKVRVKASVTTPKYKWGSVTHQSVGIVKGNITCATTFRVLAFHELRIPLPLNLEVKMQV